MTMLIDRLMIGSIPKKGVRRVVVRENAGTINSSIHPSLIQHHSLLLVRQQGKLPGKCLPGSVMDGGMSRRACRRGLAGLLGSLIGLGCGVSGME